MFTFNEMKIRKCKYSEIWHFYFSAGRRGTLNLESILEFVTGIDQEPLLGFEIEPSIIFTECIESFLPMANTCICRMTLPREAQFITLSEDLLLFEVYDLAFSNNYYGLKWCCVCLINTASIALLWYVWYFQHW